LTKSKRHHTVISKVATR